MKKKNLKHNGLKLNKNLVSNLSSEEVKGGGRRTFSCFADADTNCGAATGTCQTAVGCPATNSCPQTQACIPSISCQPVGIC